MMIQIKHLDGGYDMVKASHLDRLIRAGNIHSFKRKNGWAILGLDPIHSQRKSELYPGPNRREQDKTEPSPRPSVPVSLYGPARVEAF